MKSTLEIAAEESRRTDGSVRLHADVLQNIPATAWTVTPDGQLDFINRFYLEVTGQTWEACTVPRAVWNKSGSDLPPFLAGLHPDHKERVREIFWNGIRSGQGWVFEAPFRHIDGRYHWHQDRAVAVYGTAGELLRFVGTCADIDELKQAEEKNKALLEISSALNGVMYQPLSAHFLSARSLTVFAAVCKALRRVIVLDWAQIALCEPAKNSFQVLVTTEKQSQNTFEAGRELAREGNSFGWVFDSCLPLFRVDLQREKQYTDEHHLAAAGMESYAVLPLLIEGKCTGVLRIAGARPQPYSDQDAEFLKEVAKQISLVVANLKAYDEIALLKAKLERENTYLQDEIRTAHNFKEILGNSSELLKLLDRIEAVAPTDANVLITGETGSGKELVARAIHSRSARQKSPLVKVNCGAIPTGLVESELFGHVKGAFTSASDRRVGRFELANGGTLFLDEVGELPLETQVKLLRVLQEQEFEPVGSSRTIKVNVRIIAATNRDLEQAVQSGAFRSDLYYRLNVVPLRVPALRERRSDIPQLVISFLEQSARRMGKSVASVSQKTMDLLMDYPWPGNIRELQNVIERGVVLSRGSMLKLGADLLPVEGDHDAGGHEVPYEPDTAATLESIQRQHILRVLNQTGWLVSGPNGAGAILNLHPNTLHSTMKRLGISRPIQKDS
jgi:formate hydrogenlyase transcriptional activator